MGWMGRGVEWGGGAAAAVVVVVGCVMAWY